MSEALQQIISSKRMPVLFIGSGLSKRYLSAFPSWEQLLDQLREKIGVSKAAYSARQQQIKSQQPGITPGKLHQKMASYLRDRLLACIEQGTIDPLSLFTKEECRQCEDAGIEYFKLLVTKQLGTYTFNESKSDELALLRKIGEKVSMIYTTNYDSFLEKEVFPKFQVYASQNKYYFRTSNGFGELFKIHGCVNTPNSIIICEEDYQRFESSLKLVSSKLLNSLLDFPILFLGYSLEDENIKSILLDFMDSFSNSIIQEIKKYILLIVYEAGQEDLVEGEKVFTNEGTGKSITLTTIKTDNFQALYRYIDNLTPAASVYELRKYKTMLAELVADSSKGRKKIYVQDIEEAGASGLALYIGRQEFIEEVQKSVYIYSKEDVIQMALEGRVFDYNSFASVWYETKSISCTEYTPVFLIRNKLTIPYENCSEKFRKNYESRVNFFQTCPVKDFQGSIETIREKYRRQRCEKKDIKRVCQNICSDLFNALTSGKVSDEVGLDFLKQMLQDSADVLQQSPYKRVLCLIWYRQYEQKKAQRTG